MLTGNVSTYISTKESNKQTDIMYSLLLRGGGDKKRSMMACIFNESAAFPPQRLLSVVARVLDKYQQFVNNYVVSVE